MPNYIVNSCLDPLQSYIVSATSLSTGEIIGFNSFEENFCGQVIESTEATHNAIYIESFEDCCGCLSAATTNDYASFEFQICNSGELINIELGTFCSVYGSNPTIGQVFLLFNENTEKQVCATFNNASVLTGVTFWIPDEGPYTYCEDCQGTIILTAGTPYEACLVCCPCETGATITSVAVPHPVWTNNQGNTVIQAGAVQLGGPNGLYS